MPARRRQTDSTGDGQRHRRRDRNNRDDNVRTWSSFYAALTIYLLPISILGILIFLLVAIQYGGKGGWMAGGRDGSTIKSEADVPFLQPLISHLYTEFTGKPMLYHGGSGPDCTITLSSRLQKDPFALRVISLREAAKCAIMLGIADQSGMPSASSSFADRGNDDPRLLRLLEKSTLTKRFNLPAEQIVHFEKYYELKD